MKAILFIWFVAIAVGNDSVHGTVERVEFGSMEACERAAEVVRQDLLTVYKNQNFQAAFTRREALCLPVDVKFEGEVPPRK